LDSVENALRGTVAYS